MYMLPHSFTSGEDFTVAAQYISSIAALEVRAVAEPGSLVNSSENDGWMLSGMSNLVCL